MAWNELTVKRNQRSRTYQDSENPLKRCWSGTLAALHYESEIDSGVYDAESDMTPQRVDTAVFDGWRVTQNGWHYALGKDLENHGDVDGWVGFGGRSPNKPGDAHWFKFRLLRVGYLYGPTRTWQGLETPAGGDIPPTYDRAKLEDELGTLTIGPYDDPIVVSGVGNWADIWVTPDGGSLSASWVRNGDRLKENVIINQAGREWIAANRPPLTPLDETYFGFVFRLDWSDIPRAYRAGVLQDLNGDFADDGEPIELRDGLDRLLGLLPISYVSVPPTGPLPTVDRQPLRKRFWKDGDGNHYLLVGVRCDLLNQMADGPLVFDPTVDKTVGAGGDDGRRATGAEGFSAAQDYYIVGHNTNTDYLDCHLFFRWTGVTIEGTIDTSYVEVYDSDSWGQAAPYLKVYGVDEDNPAAPTTAGEFDADSLTTAAVDWDGSWTVNSYNQSPSLNSIFQELVDTYTISNDAVMVQIKNDGGAVTRYNYADFYEHDPSNPAKLHIEYTVAGRTTFNTDASPLGIHTGMAWRVNVP